MTLCIYGSIIGVQNMRLSVFNFDWFGQILLVIISRYGEHARIELLHEDNED